MGSVSKSISSSRQYLHIIKEHRFHCILPHLFTMKPLRRFLSNSCTPSLNLGNSSPNLPSTTGRIPPERSPLNPGDYLREEQSMSPPGNDQRHFFQGVSRVDINQATFVQHNGTFSCAPLISLGFTNFVSSDPNAVQAESSSTFVSSSSILIFGVS